MPDKIQSLFFGLITILCWGSLATLGNLLIHLPPFYVLGLAFLFGSVPAYFRPKELFPSLKVCLWGILGFFLYHFFLFYSFRFAPAIEANLINYLWPVLMVVLSPLFFRQETLRLHHLVGAALSVVGCVLLMMGKGGQFQLQNIKGYALAFGAALTWPIYSLGRKRLPPATVWAVGGFCMGAGLLCFVTHFMTEPRVVLQWHDAWKILIMGLGPFGLAFYCWDVALRKGDSKILGSLSYLTPVLSTTGLVLWGGQTMTSSTLLAMILIIGGASSSILGLLPSKVLKKGQEVC